MKLLLPLLFLCSCATLLQDEDEVLDQVIQEEQKAKSFIESFEKHNWRW